MEDAPVSFYIPSFDLFLADGSLIDLGRTSRTASIFIVGMNRQIGK